MKARHAQVANVIPFSWVDGPGNRFVLFLQGCNFNCLACHNPQTIPLHTRRARELTVSQILDQIKESMPYISGVTISGGEATVQHEFIAELFTAIKESDELSALTTFIDSNGNASAEVWDQLAKVTDGVMLDLKALDEQRHIELTGNTNSVVLDSIKHLQKLGKLYEVRLLLIPGINDSDQQLIDTAVWLKNIDPAMRIKINAFKTHGVRAAAKNWPEVCHEDMSRYSAIIS